MLVLAPAVGLAVWGLLAARSPARSEVGKVERLAPDVYFYEGDFKGRGHCNNGWVIFQDYVLVIDANFPSGAKETLAKIREMTDKPVRFAFDTHHHGDHAYGNQVWVDNGAVPVAHTGVAEEMKKYEPSRWEEAAKGREDVRESKLKPPSVLFPDTLIFDDGQRRVELRHYGVAHTRGDGFAWLPKEKILFTGDACVNGPYNYMGDGDSGEWVKTLSRAQRLGATRVGPGHGPTGTGALIEEQILYFQTLRRRVKNETSGKSPTEAQAAVETIRGQITADPRIARYVGDSFPAQVAKVYQELTGKSFPDRQAEHNAQRWHLAWHHPHEH
jgi:glyoxylase-like metal-dependent hydrolase (beta-lactamase superfamily II)